MGKYAIRRLLSLYAFKLLHIQLDFIKAFVGKKHEANGRREQKIS